MKLKTPLFIVLFNFASLPNLIAQNNSPQINDTIVSKHVFGISWNSASLVQNYPSFLFSGVYLWKEKLSIELGGSKLLNSEIFSSSDANTEHKYGFKLVGELKYYFDNTARNNGPYIGAGYAHIESTFQADYIVKIIEEDQRYFRLVDEEYYSNIDQFYAKIGYRFLSSDKRVFFETGINVGLKIKTVTPQPSNYGGRLVTNEKFVENISQFPLPMSIDAKLGFVIFK